MQRPCQLARWYPDYATDPHRVPVGFDSFVSGVRSIWPHPTRQRRGRVPTPRPRAVAFLYVQHAPRHCVRIEQDHFVEEHSTTHAPEHARSSLQATRFGAEHPSLAFRSVSRLENSGSPAQAALSALPGEFRRHNVSKVWCNSYTLRVTHMHAGTHVGCGRPCAAMAAGLSHWFWPGLVMTLPSRCAKRGMHSTHTRTAAAGCATRE